ncbi:nucleolar MIF4G domain-containing protein 1-like [Mizuhopecten yessoensis]|uniref:Nucleolar MIF4G domain-containing protein 1 n=1 Tax=Mizuhopecten yessoensis TaxID=6573 RepID=A0A210PU87_MIZYE|nr:nucleolar MIF4G domain-containing protein 1-like [Mizuhopecten yessoensis]OWF40014.1 Nucleolar MIF4G domain-containing protein 1 [Mizuhopecten yessoensis]
MGVKRKVFRKDPQNLKRFRTEITELFGEELKSSDRHGSKGKKVKGRKQKRKEMKQLKKARKLAFSQHKPMPTLETQFKKEKTIEREKKQKEKIKQRKKKAKAKKKEEKEKISDIRKKNMELELRQEERMLKQLEKQLHLNKRKKKTLPQSFVADGLDYLLDAVDEDKLKNDFEDKNDLDSDFDSDQGDLEDADLGWLKSKKKKARLQAEMENEAEDEDEDEDDDEEEDEDEDEDEFSDEDEMSDNEFDKIDDREKFSRVEVIQSLSTASDIKSILKSSDKSSLAKKQKSENRVKFPESVASKMPDSETHGMDNSDNDPYFSDESEGSEKINEEEKKDKLNKTPELKEDIYGRLRDAQGNVVQASTVSGTYVPPAKRLAMAGGDEKHKIRLDRLRKQLKGLVNRVSQANINPISSQIEEIYRTNSRAEMNETLAEIILDACVSVVITPERLAMELMMLLAILHGNVGMEVGATFTQTLAERFSSCCSQSDRYGEGKEVDNIVLLFSYLYNFKIIHNILIMDLIKKFVAAFQEKDIELLLLLLKNVGFSLRKDDPMVLKQVIQDIQTKARDVDTSHFEEKTRVRFMLDTLLAIKNNNMRKIPNYDPDHLEQLKKQTRVYLRGHGLGVGQLRISLDDLLQADAKGRWWVVGSAWVGRDQQQPDSDEVAKTTEMNQSLEIMKSSSSKILELARKQRMNTDIRRNIFCTIMSSEDFVDAFERLLRLGLKHQQEREIIHVILDCCQQEKSFNPFYAYLLQKFCEYDRRFQMTFQFTMWDKFKEMSNLSERNRDNLARMVLHLLATKAVSLSLFKVVEFGSLDKIMVRFMKQVFRGLLLDHPEDAIEACFMRIAPLTKLHMLHEGLKLFMQHFLLKKSSAEMKDYALLKDRVSLADRALSSSQSKMLL